MKNGCSERSKGGKGGRAGTREGPKEGGKRETEGDMEGGEQLGRNGRREETGLRKRQKG